MGTEPMPVPTRDVLWIEVVFDSNTLAYKNVLVTIHAIFD